MEMHFFIKVLIFFAGLVLCYGDNPCNKVKKEYGYVCVCNATYCDTISRPKKLSPGQFHIYSSSDENPGFNHATGFFRMQSLSPHGEKYVVNITKQFQTIRGIGGSFTDSFGYVFNTLSYEAQENLLRSYFSKDGVEYSVCRVVLGASDFGLRYYSYVPEYDPSLKSFNLTEDDYLYKIPQIKRALNMSSRPISLLGSTWSPPNWMKVNNVISAQYLQKEFQQLWADYHVKMFDTFKAEGIDFWGMTTGNEPITLFQFHLFFPSLIMFPEEQRDWVINKLGPTLRKHNYTTKIILLDDQRLYALWWMKTVMRDPLAKDYVLGIGLHWYFDNLCPVNVLDIINEKFPEQEILYTESSVNPAVNSKLMRVTDVSDGSNVIGFDPQPPRLGLWHLAGLYISNIIENMSHWVTTYLDWNLSLNLDGGPNVSNLTCDAAIIINKTEDEFYKQPTFYAIGHFSKFLQPGSKVIDVNSVKNVPFQQDIAPSTPPTTVSTSTIFPVFPTRPPIVDVKHIGVLNPDGSRTIIFYNPKSSPTKITIYDPDRGYAFLILESHSINSVIYW
ncbi:lysosomal acid glucosylceramidase-like [Lycorma delicatula]|uniref:lysosomal acid glucosylceramidase-like n=1 Tax=Lycorma delicatula TaxID=130591 RepID=UPI003F51A720